MASKQLEQEEGEVRKKNPSRRGEGSGGSDMVDFSEGKSNLGSFLPAGTCAAIPSAPAFFSSQAGKSVIEMTQENTQTASLPCRIHHCIAAESPWSANKYLRATSIRCHHIPTARVIWARTPEDIPAEFGEFTHLHNANACRI